MINNRQEFIKLFFEEIAELDYTLLKFTEGELSKIDDNSDLDLLLEKPTLPFLNSIIRNAENLESMDVSNLESMSQFFLFFKDGSFLQIDCLFKLIRKNLIYLTNEYVFANTKNINGVKTYSPTVLFEHIVLFHQLNNDGMPSKYVKYFESLPEAQLFEVIDSFNKKYNWDLSISNVNKEDPGLNETLVSYLDHQPFNGFSTKIKSTFNYFKDTFLNLISCKGKVITFSGVDGAGKSTILAETQEMLEKKFRKKVIVLRHRPSLLPILSSVQYGKKGAEKRAAEKMPRQGNNKSSLGSFLRFAYYYTDYLFGQWYIFFRYQMFNYIVLYDRYYFDFIVDGKRSNIILDSRITKLLYRFVHKPKLNFFLYAPSQIILKRKKELSAKDIDSLTTNYQDLFANFSDKYDQKYLPIKNIDKEVTLDYIQKELQNIL